MTSGSPFVPAVPGSRSISARALICAALSDGRSEIRGLANCDDTTAMCNTLTGGGIAIQRKGDSVVIDGTSMPEFTDGALDCQASGTTMRFISALALLTSQSLTLTGTQRLLERPLGGLETALVSLGKSVTTTNSTRTITCAPVMANEIAVDARKSGQFVSGLLMALAAAGTPIVLRAVAPASLPFIHMTVSVMRAFGAEVTMTSRNSDLEFKLAGTGYRPTTFTVEPDIMGANYFLAAPLVTCRSVFVPHIGEDTIQGDVAMLSVLARMGALIEWRDGGVYAHCGAGHAINATVTDIRDIPDMALTLGAIAALAAGPTTLTGTSILRYKESDRLIALATELRKIGASVDFTDDSDIVTITPGGRLIPAEIDTYDDHRMAMAFALLTLAEPRITILQQECVAKTWPGFFAELERYRAGNNLG